MREYLRRYEEAGVDQVIFTAQAGKNRHEHIMESLELFGREVLPEFNGRDEPAAARARRSGSQPVIEQAAWPASPRRTTRRCRRRTTRSPRSRGAIADRSGSDDFHAWLDEFAEQSAAGGDQMRDLIG